jgi:hypothetical protein
MARVSPGRYLTVERTTFETGWQNVAQHYHRIFFLSRWDLVQARIGMGNTNVFRLRAIDPVTEDPSTGCTVRVHALFAVVALTAHRAKSIRDRHMLVLS